jgi:hypothetical protein
MKNIQRPRGILPRHPPPLAQPFLKVDNELKDK